MPTIQEIPREFGWMDGCPLTPFHNHQEGFSGKSRTLLDLSRLPRSNYRSRLGEGSVRSSLENLFLFLILVSLFAASRSAYGTEIVVSHSDALVRAVRNHVAEVTPWKESEIEARLIADFSGAVLPAGETDFSISNREPIATFKHALLPVDVMQNGKTVRTIWIAADIIIRAQVVQAAARITFGSTIAPADVKEALTEITDARAQYFRACSEVIDKVMRRTLSPGDPLTRDTVTNPLLIHSGETVRVRLERGPIVLSAMAKAEQDGKLGESIRIRNLDFSRSLKATVIGRGEVRIE
jgi:flagella basal body P-ring formation protein FlgA